MSATVIKDHREVHQLLKSKLPVELSIKEIISRMRDCERQILALKNQCDALLTYGGFKYGYDAILKELEIKDV